MNGLFDDFTPRAVWLEYGARKSAIVAGVVREEVYRTLLDKLADELGCGVVPSALNEAQRAAQEAAERKWGER